MELLNSMNPCDLVVFSTAIAVCLSDSLTANELNVLGNFLAAVGGLIMTWAAQKQSLSETSKSSDNEQISLNELKSAIEDLQKKLKKLER